MSMKFYYLSFSDGEDFLGAAIVSAFSSEGAVEVSHSLGINPGGQVQGHEVVGPSKDESLTVPPEFVGKLLGDAELSRLANWAVGLNPDGSTP